MYNVGAFFRAADGVGLQKVCLCGITAHPPKKAISKTALGAEEVVPWEHDWDAGRMAEGLRRKGFEIAAIEASLHSVDLFEWQPKFPVCVAFGHEVDGLGPELLEIADTQVRIPMLGKKTSLNVVTAAGVVLYELLRKFRTLNLNAAASNHDGVGCTDGKTGSAPRFCRWSAMGRGASSAQRAQVGMGSNGEETVVGIVYLYAKPLDEFISRASNLVRSCCLDHSPV